eukprot:TRINITY_DN69986_c0_g1_i1.p1 TRINITY_DN69986_c0_g1~~TRINITY_DN69986_c0_g1_i1.p1  ORF type:complete len:369 (-),score=58.46 TRINITY_DN69986_c0_g1_i1:32-1063(-)
MAERSDTVFQREHVDAEPASDTLDAESEERPPSSSFGAPQSDVDRKAADDEALKKCADIVLEASAVEERAMTFDRAGAYPGAVDLYRKAADKLAEAVQLCPEWHADLGTINRHVLEVRTRAAYLDSLGRNPADIPLEEHIHGSQLTLATDASSASKGGYPAEKRQTLGAAAVGGAAGLLLLGPHIGAAVVAVGAACAANRSDKVGQVSRGVGDMGASAIESAASSRRVVEARESVAESCKQVDEKLHITAAARTVDDRLGVSDKAQSAADKLRQVDEKYALSEKAMQAAERTQHASQAAASKAAESISEFNTKYDVTGKLSRGTVSAASTVAGWVGKAMSKRS